MPRLGELSLPAVKTALQDGGSHELTLTGLTGAATKVVHAFGSVRSGGANTTKGIFTFYRLNGDGDYMTFFIESQMALTFV